MLRSRLGRRIRRQFQLVVALIATIAMLAAGGAAVGLTPASAAAPKVKAADARPVLTPDDPPSNQQPHVIPSGAPAPPAVTGPAEHVAGAGHTLAANSDQIAALDSQLPLGLGSKGSVYVPPPTSPEAQASAQAKATGQPVEVVADRDEHNSVLANPDGTFTDQDWIDIQHVKQGDSWVDVDTNLSADGGVLQPGATKDQLTLSDGGGTQAATLSDGTNTVGLPFSGSLPVPTISGNTATYANVLPGIDFVQSATTSGVEQSLVIKQRPAAALATWKLPLKLSGLHAVAGQGGTVSLLDSSNNAVFSSGPAVMTDATGLRSEQLNAPLTTTASGPEVDVTADAAWLADPATKYPVTIDPSTNFTEYNHTYVDSNNPTTNYSTSSYLWAGRDAGQTNTQRAFVGFNTGASVHGTVTSASVYMHIYAQNNSSDTTDMYDSNTVSSSTTYNAQPTIHTKWATVNGTGSGGWQVFGATSMMQAFDTNGVYQGTIALEATNEADSNYMKKYDSGQSGTDSPYISITYTSAAGQATGLTSAQTSTFTPKLSGTSVNADGGNVTSYFYVESPGSSTPDIENGAPVTVPSGSVASLTLLGGLVRANTTYSWWMQSCSSGGLCTDPTAHQSFTIDPLLGAGLGLASQFSFTSIPITDQLGLKVNNATGNLVATANDISLAGLTGNLAVGRTYNSLANAPGSSNTGGFGTGYGWQMTGADSYVVANPDGSATVWFSDGSVANFLPGCTSPSYCTPPGLDADLNQLGGGGWTLTDHATQDQQIFNTSGQLTDTADRNGNKFHYTYANEGCGTQQVSTITGTRGDMTGRVLHFSYNSAALGCSRSGISQTDSGSNSRSVSITQIVGGVNYALEMGTTDPAGGSYSFNYTGKDLTYILTPDGHETDIAYDSSHRVSSITQDPSGIDAVTHFSYPAVGQMNVQDPDSHTTTYTSDPYGRVTSVLDANSHTQSAGWTPLMKVGLTTNALGGTVTNSYDSNPANSGVGVASTGESLTKSQTTGTSGASTSATWGITSPSSPGDSYLMATSTDSIGSMTTYAYDNSGNNDSQSKSPDETFTDYNTSTHGNFTNFPGTINFTTEPKNKGGGNSVPAHCTRTDSTVDNCTYYSYDTLGDLTGITPVNGASNLVAQSFTYDGFGRLKTAVSGNGITTTYSYDNDDRSLGTSYSGSMSTVTLAYDGDGNLTSQVDGSGTTGYKYDTLNRLLGKNIGSATVTCPSSPSNSQLCYTYDNAGNLHTLSDGRGTTTYTYDAANNLTKMVEGSSGNTDLFAYNADNQRIDTWYDASGTLASTTDPCGATSVYAPPTFAGHEADGYDTDGRLTCIKGSRASSDTTLLENLAYSYNAGSSHTNQVQTRTDNLASLTTTYTYPVAQGAGTSGTGGRLASAVTPSGTSYYYCYDADGNMTNTSTTSISCSAPAIHTYNAANEITDSGYGTGVYDADGNLTKSLSSSPTLFSLTYSGADTTTSITPTGQPADLLAYAGSTQDERVSQSKPSATSYANGLGIQSQTVGTSTSYFERDPSGTLISQYTSSGEYYYFTDNIGSVLALVDTTGAQVAAYTYDPYGGHATVAAASSPNTNIANANPYRYAGVYFDSTTGLYAMGARYYDPTLNRFTQLDPQSHLLDLRQGDSYGYAGDDPVNAQDPSGTNICVSHVWFLGGGTHCTGIFDPIKRFLNNPFTRAIHRAENSLVNYCYGTPDFGLESLLSGLLCNPVGNPGNGGEPPFIIEY